MMNDQRSMMNAERSMMNAERSMMNDQRSMMNAERSNQSVSFGRSPSQICQIMVRFCEGKKRIIKNRIEIK